MSISITIIGTGYVGLVSGACLAEIGHNVVCVDKEQRKIDMLHDGDIPIYEPGLAEMVQRNVSAGRLRFTMDVEGSIPNADAVFIAVGTPTLANSDEADLQYVQAAVREVAEHMKGFTVLVTKSTVPVGTNQQVFDIARASAPKAAKLAVASNPEFLREGAAIEDFMKPDRIVVGTDDSRASEIMGRVYEPLTKNGTTYLETGLQTAEMIKYAANAFLAVKISYINEIANLCELVDADVDQVADGMGLDHRIGRAFLNTGPGWGGSCFPKDTRALLATAESVETQAQIVEAAIAVNEKRKGDMVQKIVDACGGDVSGKSIAVLGVTFKGQTDDMRESTSLVVLPELIKMGARIRAYDPAHPKEAKTLLRQVPLLANAGEACDEADVLVVMTDWQEFKSYDLKVLAGKMKTPRMVDLRNLFNAKTAIKSGFWEYVSLGRANVGGDNNISVAAE